MYGNTTTAGQVGNQSSTIPVRGDTVAGGVVQAFKELDSTEGSSTPVGTDANPKKVRPRRAGTVDYDSGVFDVDEGAPQSITSATIYVEGGFVSNHSTEPRVVTFTNAADEELPVISLEPKETKPIPAVSPGAWVGLKAGANGVGVRAQIVGAQ